MDIGIINTVGVAMVSVVLMLVRVVRNGDKRRHEFSHKSIDPLKVLFCTADVPMHRLMHRCIRYKSQNSYQESCGNGIQVTTRK